MGWEIGHGPYRSHVTFLEAFQSGASLVFVYFYCIEYTSRLHQHLLLAFQNLALVSEYHLLQLLWLL